MEISKGNHYRDILQLAGPIAGIQFAQVALTSTDLLVMGFIDIKALAAGGLALLLYNQLRTMCVGMVTGTGNLISQAIGRSETHGDVASANEAVRHLLRAALLVATLVASAAALLFIGVGHLLAVFGQSPEVSALAKPIIMTLAPGLLPMVWLNVLRQFAVGMRRAGSLFKVTLMSIVVNVLLDGVFAFGWFGVPELGLAGIGLSTTLVQTWTLLVYLRHLRRDGVLSGLVVLDAWRAPKVAVEQIGRMGIPISLTYGSEAVITSIATMLMGTFGPIALAASNIVNQLAFIAYQLNIGLSQGSSILISCMAGRERLHEIGAIARQTMTVSLGIMTLIALIYALIPEIVLRPFFGEEADPAVFSIARTLLWFAIAHQYFKGSQNICVGLLRGLGNTRSSLESTLIGYWAVGIPAMLLLAYGLGWQGYGVWSGLCLGFGITSVLLWSRFARELRGHTSVLETPGSISNGAQRQ